MMLWVVALLPYKADHSSDKGHNSNPKDQFWLESGTFVQTTLFKHSLDLNLQLHQRGQALYKNFASQP